jgi:hypothetical protein
MRKTTSQTTTAWRGYGDETPIGKWIRGNTKLPSRSSDSAFSVTNTDLTIHAYMQCIDGRGTRAVQSVIRVEFKSHAKIPKSWQLDTLFKEHAGINRSPRGYKVKGACVINHGIYVCVCSGATPEDSQLISWGRFNRDGSTSWQSITLSQLNAILRFDLHPKTLKREWLRRHHKKSTVMKVVTTPLGFEVDHELVTQS